MLRYAQARNVGVVRLDSADQLLECGYQVNALDVHSQARGVFHQLRVGHQCCIRLDGDACVVLRWPYPHGDDARCVGQMGCTQPQSQAATAQPFAA